MDTTTDPPGATSSWGNAEWPLHGNEVVTREMLKSLRAQVGWPRFNQVGCARGIDSVDGCISLDGTRNHLANFADACVWHLDSLALRTIARMLARHCVSYSVDE